LGDDGIRLALAVLHPNKIDVTLVLNATPLSVTIGVWKAVGVARGDRDRRHGTGNRRPSLGA
jgi:hypothetical protein